MVDQEIDGHQNQNTQENDRAEQSSPVRVGSDDRPAPGAAPMTAALLARLAEAVDGKRDGSLGFFIARQRPNPSNNRFEVQGPYTTEAQLDTAWNNLPAGRGQVYAVFGPFQAGMDPPSRATGTAVEASLQVEFANNPINPTTFRLPAEEYDAVFLSPAAVEKFAIPYYTGLYGAEEANRIFNAFMNATDVRVMLHRLGTDETIGIGGLRVTGGGQTLKFFSFA